MPKFTLYEIGNLEMIYKPIKKCTLRAMKQLNKLEKQELLNEMIYTIVDRPNIIQTIDNKFSESMIILGSFCPFYGDLLPPHFRGVVCFYTAIKEE